MSFYNNINNIPSLHECKELRYGEIYRYYPFEVKDNEPHLVQIVKCNDKNEPCVNCCFGHSGSCLIRREVGRSCSSFEIAVNDKFNIEDIDFHFERYEFLQ